jgi:hypothetical protein
MISRFIHIPLDHKNVACNGNLIKKEKRRRNRKSNCLGCYRAAPDAQNNATGDRVAVTAKFDVRSLCLTQSWG